MKRSLFLGIVLGLVSLGLTAGLFAESRPRLVMFVGVDVSGSFLNGRHYEGAIEFLGPYIHGHLNGIDGLEKPHALFVGSIGGSRKGDRKTLYPIQTFEHKSVLEIQEKLREIFPKEKQNRFTDFNAFFGQVASTIRSRKLILKPVSIVLVSDGKIDMPGVKSRHDYRAIQVKPLENLSRNITVRLLYTDAVTADHWQEKVPRRRVKLWTQDAVVMQTWKDVKIYDPKKKIGEQQRFFAWVKDNVDFGVRSRRVD
jgi:hypothetical protein